MDEENYYEEDYNNEPSYHSYRYNQPVDKDDWYYSDEMED